MTTDPAELIQQALSNVELAERALEDRRRAEVESIKDAIRSARTDLEAAAAGFRALAAVERDEARVG